LRSIKDLVCRNPVAAYIFLFCRDYEGVPLSLPAGEAACRDHPLDPPSPSLPSLKRISLQPSEELSHFFPGCPYGKD